MVTLRSVMPADIDAFYAHQCDGVSVQMAAFTSKDPTDRQAHDAHWSRILANESIVARTVLLDGEVAGHVVRFEREGVPEVTYWIDRACWGRGVATDALGLLLREVTGRPIFARAAADNAASVRVLAKCGFVEHARERGFAEARGEEIDEVVMVLR